MNTIQEQILEGNKLIAEFMGAELMSDTSLIDDDPKMKYWMYKDPIHHKSRIHAADKIRYHTSWDWLMPVVEKIEGIEVDGYNGAWKLNLDPWEVQFIDYTDESHDSVVSITRSDFDTLIEATWQAVVQFIQWFNNTQNK